MTATVSTHELIVGLLDIKDPAAWIGLDYNDLPKSTVYRVQINGGSWTYVRETKTWYDNDPSKVRRVDLPNYPLGINRHGLVASGRQSIEHLIESYYLKMERAPRGGRQAIEQYFGPDSPG
jgi:hypothetical protein